MPTSPHASPNRSGLAWPSTPSSSTDANSHRITPSCALQALQQPLSPATAPTTESPISPQMESYVALQDDSERFRTGRAVHDGHGRQLRRLRRLKKLMHRLIGMISGG